MKFTHCKMPKAGTEIKSGEHEFYAEKLANYLMWVPSSILRTAMKQMYKNSPCFKEIVKYIQENE